MRILLVPIMFVFTGAVTCKKDVGDDQYTTYYYRQTQCADGWQNSANDSVTIVNVSNYLKGLGLFFAAINIKADSPAQVCLACTCLTGKTIYVTSFNSDSTKAQYLRIGFKQ